MLSAAAETGSAEVVRWLLSAQARVDQINQDGCTPLWVSCERGHRAVAQLLVEAGAAVNGVDNCIPLHAATGNGDAELMRLLISARAQVDQVDQEGRTALYGACQAGHLEMAMLLVASQALLDQADQHGRTPLSAACDAGHLDIVTLLVSAQAQVDQADGVGRTALYVACQAGWLEVAMLLVSSQAQVDQPDQGGQTPLWVACQKGHVKVATLLLSAQAWVDQADGGGRTPLYIASANGHLDLVRLLVSSQATISQSANDGSTPQSIASKNGQLEVAMLLVSAQSSALFSGVAPATSSSPPTLSRTIAPLDSPTASSSTSPTAISTITPTADPAADPATASPAAAPTTGRKTNRWGEGLDAPAAGARVFFPNGWVPQRDVAQAIAVFGHEPAQLEHVLLRGRQIAMGLQSVYATLVDPEHAAAVFAYTQEDPVTQLYTKCNEACRSTGAAAEKRIALYRDYLYHLTQALSALPAFAGTTYRGVRAVMPPDCYAVGKTVTWQAFTSTTQAATRTVPFLVQNGKKLQGSLFVLRVKTGKDIAEFSEFQYEREVLLGLNSAFQVTGRCKTRREKKAAVPDLAGYDLQPLDVYLMKQL
eukprot:EG_transcript_5769